LTANKLLGDQGKESSETDNAPSRAEIRHLLAKLTNDQIEEARKRGGVLKKEKPKQ